MNATAATLAHYGNYTTPHNIRRVWAAVTQTPCATTKELGAELGMSFGVVSMALRVLRDAGYIDYAPGTHHARTVLVKFYVQMQE